MSDAERKGSGPAGADASRAFLAGVIDALADPVFVKDSAHRWVALNLAFCRFMGYERETLLGKSDFDFFPRDEATVFWDRDDRVFAVGGEDVNEELFTDAAGVTHVIVTKKTVFTDARGDRYLVGVIRDVSELRRVQQELVEHRERLEELVRQRTAQLSAANEQLRREMAERQRAEEERRRLEAQFQQVQKLESLGVLAGGIAHDFNNLLAGMLGNAELALSETPPGGRAHAYLDEIKRAAIRSAGLTNQMLAYSGHGRFVVETVDLDVLVRDIAGLLAAGTARKVETRFSSVTDLPPIRVDTAQVRQVAMNLLANAAEAIGDGGGAVTVRTGVAIHPGGPVPGAVLDEPLAAGRYVSLEVADEGCGMDEATRARIFDPFFTTKATGRGLGLAAVLGIIRGHRGSISVESAPGRGSVFRVLIPAWEGALPEAAPEPAAPAVAGTDWTRAGKILVAEDDPMLLDMTRRLLESSGLRVLTASDGEEALGVFGRHADEVAAVLLDLTMPVMGGAAALVAIRKVRPGVRVVVMSGYSETDVGEGADDFLQKPFTRDALLAAVRRAVEGGRTR